MPQPHPPAPLAQRPEPGAQLLEAVRQRQTQCSLQLAQQWVHRRGVVDLQRFCNTELLHAEGAEALAWLQDLLELDAPSAPVGESTLAGGAGPATGETASRGTMSAPHGIVASSSEGGAITAATERTTEIIPNGAGEGASSTAPAALSEAAEPFEAPPAAPGTPLLQADEALASELQARAVAAVDEAFAALAQTFQGDFSSAASLPAPATAPLSFTIEPTAHGTAATPTGVPPQPLPVRVGLWPSLRASAASFGAALRNAGGKPQAAAPAAAPSEMAAAVVLEPTPISAAEPEPASSEPLPPEGPSAAEVPEPLASGPPHASDPLESPIAPPVELPSATAEPDDAPELDAAAAAASPSGTALGEAAGTAVLETAVLETALLHPEVSEPEPTESELATIEATETGILETGILETEIPETVPRAMPAVASNPRVGLLQRLRRRIRKPRLPRMTRLRAVMRDCFEESVALLRTPALELNDDPELRDDDDFNPVMPLEPSLSLPASEQPLEQPLAQPPARRQRPNRPMALVASQPPKPAQSPPVSQQPPLSWVIDPPAPPDAASERASASRGEPQPPASIPAAVSADVTPAAPAADIAITAAAASRSWKAADTAAATPAAPPSVAPLRPARSDRKPAIGSDRPAPAPAALSDLRAWLPDRGDLPRAS